MFYFSSSQVPTSFAGQALLCGANSMLLNPPNILQNNRWSTFIAKPIRAIVRLIYAIAITIFLTPIGVVYHLAATIRYSLDFCIADKRRRPELKAYAREHLKASIYDIACWSLFPLLEFSLAPNKAMGVLHSSTLVTVPRLNGYADLTKAFKNYHYHFRELVRISLISREELGYTVALDERIDVVWREVNYNAYAYKIPVRINPNSYTYQLNNNPDYVRFQHPGYPAWGIIPFSVTDQPVIGN